MAINRSIRGVLVGDPEANGDSYRWMTGDLEINAPQSSSASSGRVNRKLRKKILIGILCFALLHAAVAFAAAIFGG